MEKNVNGLIFFMSCISKRVKYILLQLQTVRVLTQLMQMAKAYPARLQHFCHKEQPAMSCISTQSIWNLSPVRTFPCISHLLAGLMWNLVILLKSQWCNVDIYWLFIELPCRFKITFQSKILVIF